MRAPEVAVPVNVTAAPCTVPDGRSSLRRTGAEDTAAPLAVAGVVVVWECEDALRRGALESAPKAKKISRLVRIAGHIRRFPPGGRPVEGGSPASCGDVRSGVGEAVPDMYQRSPTCVGPARSLCADLTPIGPCAVVVARVCLALQGHGYDYTEMAHLTSATIRTVERQVLRARSKLAATDG